MTSSLKNKTARGIIWSSVERFSVQGVQFLVMIIMARLLTPEDYGLVGMLTVFTAVSQSLIDSGFSQALIRKQDRTETDNSTVFYFNLVIGVFLYAVLFLSAPLIADFYDEPVLVNITRVLCISVFINSLVVVQRALLTARIDFKTQAKAALFAAILSGIIGIWMASVGYGVWSIVAQQLVNLGCNALLLWIFFRWHPSLCYSWRSFRELFTFGSKLLASGLLDTLYRNIYLIVIGKVFSASDLGYYTRTYQFSEFPSSNVTGIMQRVTYPVLCSIKDENARLANIIFPLMMGLAAVAHPLVLVLLKEQWLFCATLLPILCFSMMWYPVHSINLNLLQVKGRSDLFLRLEIIKKVLGVLVLCITLPMGLIAMCTGSVFSSVLCLVINTRYTGKLINIGFLIQVKDLLPSFVLSLSMGILVWSVVHILALPSLLSLIVGVLVGMVYYILFAILFRFKELKELMEVLRK